MGNGSGAKVGIIIGIIIIVIVVIAIIAALAYYFLYYKKKKATVVVVTPAVDTTTTAVSTTATRALKSYNGSLSNNRSFSIYWNDQSSGLYVLQYNNTMQYGCFTAANNILGGSRVMIFPPSYSGTPLVVPDASTCSNTVSQPVATLVISAPNAMGTVNATITSVNNSSGTNNLNLISGESFTLS